MSFVPSIRRNLVSISSLVKNGYSLYFNKRKVFKENKCFNCSGQLVDDLYIINHASPILRRNELNSINSLPCKRKEPSKCLWFDFNDSKSRTSYSWALHIYWTWCILSINLFVGDQKLGVYSCPQSLSDLRSELWQRFTDTLFLRRGSLSK